MSLRSEVVKNWRKSSKDRIIVSMGGSCQVCQYKRCSSALELHHINPLEKDISISKLRSNGNCWEATVKELRKCILLCSNCHRELHSNLIEMPKQFSSFNEDYLEYKTKQPEDNCPVCDSLKLKSHKFCSHKCTQQSKRKIDWDSTDIQSLYKELHTHLAVAEYLGVSGKTVAKYLKRFTT